MCAKQCHRSRKKAVEEATYRAGARDVAIIEEPIAAAIELELILQFHLEI